jgi:hypothetical protein
VQLPRLKENVPGYIPWLYKLQITEQFGDIAISKSMFRQSKRREVGKFDMRIDAIYLGGPGALQKQSVGLGNRAAELKAIPSYHALTFFRDRLI